MNTINHNGQMRSRLKALRLQMLNPTYGGIDLSNQQPYDFDRASIPQSSSPLIVGNDYSNTELEEPVLDTTNTAPATVVLEDTTSVTQPEASDSVSTSVHNVDSLRKEQQITIEDTPTIQANLTKDGEGSINYIADSTFRFINGVQATIKGKYAGEKLLADYDIDVLNLQKEYLLTRKELVTVSLQLNDAYIIGDTERIRALVPRRDELLSRLSELYPSFKKASMNYWEEIGHTTVAEENVNEKLANIDAAIEKRKTIANEALEEVGDWQAIMNKTNDIYRVSDEWMRRELEGSWVYGIPNALGTSATSLAAGAATAVATAGANYLATQVSAAPLGPASPYAAFGAALVGAGTSIATTIWSRNQESLAEVSNNYASSLQEYAKKNGIDINAILDMGREELKQLSGNDYSQAEDTEVMADMLAYDVHIGNKQLDAYRAKMKSGLKEIYNRNMMLGVSDLAQTFVMVPGIGKGFGKALDALDVSNKAVRSTVRVIDKMVDNTLKYVGKPMSNVARTRMNKYILDPIVRVGVTGVMEGIEEGTQFMIPYEIEKRLERTGEVGSTPMFSPFDMGKMMLQNTGMAVQSVLGAMGISNDPYLNNSEDLKKSLLIGFAVGGLMGGGSLVVRTVNDNRSYNAGRDLARHILTEHVSAKEDMYKYIEYAKRADFNFANKEAFMEAIDQQIKDGAIPEGWTAEDLEAEKKNISEIFDIMKQYRHFNDVGFVEDLVEPNHIPEYKKYRKYTAAALLKLSRDNYNRSIEALTEQEKAINAVYNEVAKEQSELNGLHGIGEEVSSFVNRLRVLRAKLEAYENIEKMPLTESAATDLMVRQAETKQEIREIEEYLKNYSKPVASQSPLLSTRESLIAEEMKLFYAQNNFRQALDKAARLWNEKDGAAELAIAVNKYIKTLDEASEEATVEEQPIPEVTTPDLTEEEKEEFSKNWLNESKNAVEESTATEPEIAPTVEPEVESKPTTETTPETIVPPVKESEEKEELSDEEVNSFENLLNQAVSGEEEDMDYSEQSLTDEDFAADEQTDDNTVESGNATVEASAQPEAKPEPTSEPDVPVLNSDGTNPVISEEDAKLSERYDRDQESPVINSTEMVVGTLYYQFTDTPLFSGYESGNALNDFASVPGNITSSKITAKVGPSTSEYGQYDPADKSTWDNAAIYIEIEAPDDRKFMATFKTIAGAEALYAQHGMALSDEERTNLRDLRNQIIEAKLADPNVEITFANVSMTNGEFNNNRLEMTLPNGEIVNTAVNRNLLEIAALGIPKDLHDLPNSEVQFGIGKGVQDHFIIMDKDGLATGYHGGSGRIFVFPPASSTPSGKTVPIQLNEQRFLKSADGKNDGLVSFIADLVLGGMPSDPTLDKGDIMKLVFNYGQDTLLLQGDPRYEYLGPKLFYFNHKEQWAQLGTKRYQIPYLRTTEGKLVLMDFITDNLHWNTEKSIMWQPLPQSFRDAVEMNGQDSYTIAPGLTFDLEDVGLKRENGRIAKDTEHPDGLTTLAWMIKYGKLKSDMKDVLFTKPFIHVDSPIITHKPTESLKKAEVSSLNPTGASLLSMAQSGSAEEAASSEQYDAYTDPNSQQAHDFFCDDTGAPKILTEELVNDGKKINTRRAQTWLMKTFGLSEADIDVRNGVIRQFANGSAVYGMAYIDGIAISDMAIEGVQYHEAWHRVSLLMLTPETRQKLYKEFRLNYPLYTDLDDKALEEVLADRFMDYMLNDKESKLRYYITKIFRSIKKFLGFNKALNPSNLNQIYEMIKYGDFRNYKLDDASIKEFLDAYGKQGGVYYKVGPNSDIQLKHFPTLADFHSALDSLKAYLFFVNGVKHIENIKDLDTNKLKKGIENFAKSNITPQLRNALNEILENFDVFMYELQPLLEQMGIRPINEEERDETVFNNWDKAAWEYNKKENALASVKMFFGTLPDTYFEYQKVEGIQTKQHRPRKNSITGLPMIVDYDTAYALIMRNLSIIETYHTIDGVDPEQSLIGRCARLAKGNAFFAMLYRRLMTVEDINLQTQILGTVKSFNQNFVEVHYKTDATGATTFVVDEGINKRATKMYPSTWSDLFFNSALVIKTADKTIPNKTEILSIVNQFNKLFSSVTNNQNITNTDVDNYVMELVKLLNQIGITVDNTTIEALLPNDRITGIKQLILNSNPGALKFLFQDTLTNLATGKNLNYKLKGVAAVRLLNAAFMNLGADNIIDKLANAQAITHPDETGMTVLGPGNNIMYTKTQHCFVSDQIRWLNNHDAEVLQNLNADPYNQSSLILSHNKAGGSLKLNTFINFYGEGIGDKGRHYVDISPVEDYLAKMTFTYNNHIIFPTMADKKTWFTISGCTLFNKVFHMSQTNTGKTKVRFDHRLLNHMYNMWLDEYNTIVKYYASLPNVKQPIKNYHTANKGGLFRHFTGYYATVDGQMKWVDLNARLLAAIKDNTIQETLEAIRQELFDSLVKQDTFTKINNNLFKTTQNELVTAEKLGLIKKDDKGWHNVLMDHNVFESYRNEYAASNIERVRNNAEYYAILTMLGNHAANTIISTIEIEKIFTGDEAFYKNNDDKIKRLGAVLSTGDNLRDHWDISKTDLEHRRLQRRKTYTTTTINDNNIPSQQHKQLEDLFTWATTRKLLIEDGLSETEVDKLMKSPEKVEEQYPKIVALAKTLAKEDASAYGMKKKGVGAINQADAAVYIRPQMYRDIVKMLGEWSDEIEEAFNIMEGDQDWLSNTALYQKALKTLIKPLKTTYFGYNYDANLEHCIPVFNKMAMFPLFKVLATGDNKEMYDRMNAVGKYEGLAPIDQIAFESAVKVGIQGATDVYTDYTNTLLNDLSNMHITVQRFRNLRRQLITDPHTHDRTLFGTQVSTVAVSNLVPDRVYLEGTENAITGTQIKQQLFGTINAISNKGFFEVLEMFLDEDGNFDYEKASKLLIKEARSSNMGKDIENALQVNEDGTDFNVPLAAMPDSKWVETKLTSLTNKRAIDLELPGGAFILMSSFGFKSIKAVGSSAVNNGKRLVNLNSDGSMDAIISINLFSHIIPDYNKKSFKEAKDWLIANNIIGANSKPAAMGYRIPTQGLSSIAGLKIVDVLPSSVGDTIILPDEFTAQTGSDFDIDKLYIARYNYDKEGNRIQFKHANSEVTSEGFVVEESFDQYLRRRYEEEMRPLGDFNQRLFDRWVESLGSPKNVYEANSREANENLLLDTYLSVLTDKKNVDETRLPLDKVTGIIKDEILPIVDGPEQTRELVPFETVSPTYIQGKKYEYNGGKAGIGPFALNNKNHVLTQLASLMYRSDIPLLRALRFTGLADVNSKDEIIYERDEDGDVIYDENGLPNAVIEKGIRILDWLSAMINAHVDVAKDPYVIRLNVRQYTYNLTNFLIRSGFGKSTFYFMPLRIFKEMADAYDKTQGNYGVDATRSKTAQLNSEIKTIRKKYYEKYKEAAQTLGFPENISLDSKGNLTVYINDEIVGGMPAFTSDYAPELMRRDSLIELLLLGQQTELTSEEAYQYYGKQLQLSEIFLELNDLAQDMSKLVQLSQIDTKRFGSNFVEQDRFLYRLKSLIANTTLFDGSDIERYFQETFLNTKLLNGIIKPSRMFLNVMVRSKQSFKDAISQILSMIGRIDSNDESLNKTISNELEGSLRYQFLLHKDIEPEVIWKMFYGPNSMAKRLAQIKADILNGKYPEMLMQDGTIGNQLLNYLGTLTQMSTDQYAAPDIITRNRLSDNDKYLKRNIGRYWEELLESTYPEIKQFAEDLIYYQIVTTVGNSTKNGMFNMIPLSALKHVGYTEYMRNVVSSFNGRQLDFDNFFLNNWTNDKIVKPILLYEVKETNEGRILVRKMPILNSKSTINGKKYPLAFLPEMDPIGRNSDRDDIYTPYIKYRLGGNNPINTLLYKYVGNLTDDKYMQRPLYVLVDKKGLNQEGRTVKEYDEWSNSMFEFNNVEGSLTAKSPITFDDIYGLIAQSNESPKITQLWENLLKKDNLELVRDYAPTTVALTSSLEESTPVRIKNNEQVPTVQQSATLSENLSFTFADGTTIATPFKLNAQQQRALHLLEEFVNNPRKFNGSITLSGYAGTGKTSIIGIFHNYLIRKFINPVYSAPTHRANAVTAMNNPDARVMTLHSAFGLSPTLDLTQSSFDLKKLKIEPMFQPKLEPGDLLIIDEASMVNDVLYKYIEEFKDQGNVRVIYVGDPAQLAPVGDKDISKVFKDTSTNVELTKVERTGDNPILEEATNLRNGKDLSYRTKLVNGEGVEYTNSKEEADRIITLVINSDEYKLNPFHFRILSATNAAIAEANAMVRRQLFGENAAQIEVGEVLMGYDNILRKGKGDIDNSIKNSVDYVVTDVKASTKSIHLGTEEVEITGYEVQLKDAMNGRYLSEGLFIMGKDIDTRIVAKIAKHLDNLQRELSLAYRNRDYGKVDTLTKDINTLKKSTVSMRNYEQNGALKIRKTLDYGYAHTIHKSQGGTYDKVMIYAGTIDAFLDEKARQQLKYVAVSRAKHNIYILTNKQLGDPIVLGEAKAEINNTPETNAQEWSSKEGWSIEYYRNKVLPRIKEAWLIEYKLAEDQNAVPKFKGKMTFAYGDNAAPGIKSKTTFEAIKNGERTATTRYESDGNIDYWKNAKIGDIIEFSSASGETVKVAVTKPLTKLYSERQLSLFESTYNYSGGYDDDGKGTRQGDGKDKAMRLVANAFVGEITDMNSSSYTSAKFIADKIGRPINTSAGDGSVSVLGFINYATAPSVVMLARNSEFRGKSLTDYTKVTISNLAKQGVSFVVGDMPNVDSLFIDYLQEIGANFTIYHTGDTPRIRLNDNKFDDSGFSDEAMKHCKS